mmetsp:Transcript_4078/g.12425  ORF Transcript_4078/g.12425 Transcript_4078/m.12425 type:complete len:309 (-) Transcript_4078:92-1018(-)
MAPPGAGADSAGAATVGRGTEGRRGPSSPRRAPSRYARRMDPTRPRARSTGVAVGRGGRAAAVARGASSRPDPDGASHHVREARWIRRPRRSARRNCAVLPRSYADRASGVGRGAGGRRRSRANCFRRRAPATLDASDVLRGVAPESLRLVRCSDQAWDLALRAESGRAAGPPREESGVEKAFLKSARPSACAECADAFFPAVEASVDGARVPRRKVAAPPRTSSRRSDVSTCGGGLTGRTTGAGRRGAARGFQERPGSGGGPGSATGASASRTFAALSAGSSPLTSSSARRRRSNSSATWVSGPRVA